MGKHGKTLSYLPGYEVASNGDVWSVAHDWRGEGERKIVPDLNSHGYHKVRCVVNGKRSNYLVHKLVADAYIGKRPNSKAEIRHKDSNKLNNSKGNLEWGTQEENQEDNVKNGTVNKPLHKGTDMNPFLVVDDNIGMIRMATCSVEMEKSLRKDYPLAEPNSKMPGKTERYASEGKQVSGDRSVTAVLNEDKKEEIKKPEKVEKTMVPNAMIRSLKEDKIFTTDDPEVKSWMADREKAVRGKSIKADDHKEREEEEKALGLPTVSSVASQAKRQIMGPKPQPRVQAVIKPAGSLRGSGQTGMRSRAGSGTVAGSSFRAPKF